MLARHAESLFWAGRYIERAESTARMLDVTYHTHLEAMAGNESVSWHDLLKILNVDLAFSESDRILHADVVSEFLVFDPDNPGTIRSNVTHARENLRAVRELISTELWESINAFHLRVSARDLRDDVTGEPHELYAMIRTQCQTIAGVANETMPRDESWNFLSLGWMLERSITTLRLLLVRYSQLVAAGATGGFHHWVSTLKSASGSEAFRRRYRASMDPADVVAFLLMSPQFPRSVLFGLQTAEKSLSWIEGTSSPRSRPQRLLGRLRADVEFLDVKELLAGDLSVYLHMIEHNIRQVAESVEVTYFRSTDEMSINVLDPTMVRG
ncbi:alpha-E domain-containing protein [Actinospongicola halichondriae]|uniref:alpha-E domain-containing protein n=1 Tax=Actinospongicola halichondriae TaxID=3236844 RepID=UPI003D58674D